MGAATAGHLHVARRLNEALNSILTTNVGGGPIDQDVFNEAGRKGSEYFRR